MPRHICSRQVGTVRSNEEPQVDLPVQRHAQRGNETDCPCARALGTHHREHGQTLGRVWRD